MEADKESIAKGDQGDSSRVDQVIIEKDGKFELVSASDMHALAMKTDSSDEHPRAELQKKDQQQSQGEQSISMDEAKEGNKNLKEKNEELMITDENGDGVHLAPTSQNIDMEDSQCNTSGGVDHTQTNDQDTSDQKENISYINENSRQIKSSSQVSFSLEDKKIVAPDSHTRQTTCDGASLKTSSTTTLPQRNNHRLLVSRTKSAPGFRSPNKLNEEELQRRERNEAAFRAWLAKKDKELANQRRSQSARMQRSQEEIRDKHRRSELAYQAWLESKKQEYLQQRSKERSIRPVTSISKDDEERRRVAFESWLARKQGEKQKEEDNKQRSQQLHEEAAKKADPAIVAQAYKSWLHRKRVQAKDEELKREQYRRMYFRQSRRLKQSTSLRFEGF